MSFKTLENPKVGYHGNSYTILDYVDRFKIDANSGRIFVSGLLPSAPAEVELFITAHDVNFPQWQANYTVEKYSKRHILYFWF